MLNKDFEKSFPLFNHGTSIMAHLIPATEKPCLRNHLYGRFLLPWGRIHTHNVIKCFLTFIVPTHSTNIYRIASTFLNFTLAKSPIKLLL